MHRSSTPYNSPSSWSIFDFLRCIIWSLRNASDCHQLLWHFKDKWSNLEWENGNGCCHCDNFSLDLPPPSTMVTLVTRQLYQRPEHSPNLNLIKNCWRPIPIPFHYIPFHSIPIPFVIPILTTCLWSVIAPKGVDRYSCDWCQSLAFSQHSLIHVKKFKIG